MRHYQRGIATTVILIIFLLSAVAIVSAYFVFSQKQQKAASVNSFEDCAKLYPVMESYPEQCNTPDGKHFVRELNEGEREKYVQEIFTTEELPAVSRYPESTFDGWLNYTNKEFGYSLKYPANMKFKEEPDFKDSYSDLNQNKTVFALENSRMEFLINPPGRGIGPGIKSQVVKAQNVDLNKIYDATNSAIVSAFDLSSGGVGIVKIYLSNNRDEVKEAEDIFNKMLTTLHR